MAAPVALVIFGATGDLTSRKLVPALYNLSHEGQLPAGFAIVGFARHPGSHESFRNSLAAAVAEQSRFQPVNRAVWDALARGIYYQSGDYSQAADYRALEALLRQVDRTGARRPPAVLPGHAAQPVCRDHYPAWRARADWGNGRQEQEAPCASWWKSRSDEVSSRHAS